MVDTRASRWAIGLVVAGILAAMSLASWSANQAAHAERETDERNAVTYRAYTGRANGVVVRTNYDTLTAESPRLRLIVRYQPAGGEQVESWIVVASFGMVSEGDEIEVAYDPAHPERAASAWEVDVLARNPRGLERIPAEGGIADRTPSYRPAVLTGALAALILAGTAIWALRGRNRPAQ
jgi:hypothetical protein